MSGALTWSYKIMTSWGTIGAIVVVTGDVPDPNGCFSAESVSGTWNGNAVTGLSGFYGADNLLSATRPGFFAGLDGAGLSFTTTKGARPLYVNLYTNSGSDFQVLEIDDPTGLSYTYYNAGEAASVGNFTACYLAKTKILTNQGEIPVELLKAGDIVVTRSAGLKPIRWVGRQCFLGAFLRERMRPVCFKVGSLGENEPSQDLFVSPDHSVVVLDHLVHARDLVNGKSIVHVDSPPKVEYYHIDIGGHNCILAEGAWAESYAEQENRQTFHNFAEFYCAFPNHPPSWQKMCLPQICQGNPELGQLTRPIHRALPSNVS